LLFSVFRLSQTLAKLACDVKCKLLAQICGQEEELSLIHSWERIRCAGQQANFRKAVEMRLMCCVRERERERETRFSSKFDNESTTIRYVYAICIAFSEVEAVVCGTARATGDLYQINSILMNSPSTQFLMLLPFAEFIKSTRFTCVLQYHIYIYHSISLKMI